MKTAATSDEMVSLMNEGGFDLVTASGDASLRLVAGKRVQPINTDLIPSWKNVDERLQDAPWYHRRTACITASLSVGTERPDVQHRRLQGSARRAGTSCSRSMTLPDGKSNKGRVQAYDGPIYIADAATLSDGPQAGTRHQGPLRAERGPVQGGPRPAARPAHAGRPLLARRDDPDRRLQERRRRRLRLLAVPGQPAAGRQAADRLDHSRKKASPAGPTPP